ncbi:MAG: hypothetical protein AB1749_11580 [Pseudomonadota bacterium]
MRPALDIVRDATARGVSLQPDGTDILHRGPRGALGTALLDEIKARKGDIIAELQRRSANHGAEGSPGDVGGLELPPPCPADVAERAAFLQESAGLSRIEAGLDALAEHGFAHWDALAEAHREHIRAALDRLPAPRDAEGRRLLEMTRTFVASPSFPQAVALGWALIDLFGVAPVAPRVRVGEQGLVTSLALSPIGGRVEVLAEDGALIRTNSGARQTYRRFTMAMNGAVCWWECLRVDELTDDRSLWRSK